MASDHDQDTGRITSDGTLTGNAHGLPAGEHDAEIAVLDGAIAAGRADVSALLARIRAIQAEIARMPIVDPRSDDEILGYNEQGHFG